MYGHFCELFQVNANRRFSKIRFCFTIELRLLLLLFFSINYISCHRSQIYRLVIYWFYCQLVNNRNMSKMDCKNNVPNKANFG